MDESVKYRHELKYTCSAIQLAIIRSRLQLIMKPDPHAKNGQYTIRSLYFDNYENRCFYENESGTDPREKFRIRIYNASDQRISLECKRKERSKTYKTSCLLSISEYENLVTGRWIDHVDDKPALLRKFSVLMKTQLFKPVVIVEYDRTPYVYNVGNVRITLDQNIRSSDYVNGFFCENLPTRQIMSVGQHLLEVKYDELLPSFIKDVLQLGDLQQSAFSKYYLCRKYSMEGNYEF